MTPNAMKNKHKQTLRQQAQQKFARNKGSLTQPPDNGLKGKPRGSEKMNRIKHEPQDEEEKDDEKCYFLPNPFNSTTVISEKKSPLYSNWVKKLHQIRNPLRSPDEDEASPDPDLSINHFHLPFSSWRSPEEEAAEIRDQFNVSWSPTPLLQTHTGGQKLQIESTKFHRILPNSEPMSPLFSRVQLKADIVTLENHPTKHSFRTFRPLFKPTIPIRVSSLS